jgi:DNA invertase Pin-like site-specific DNA recombinase|nr:recombinase family protein [Mediterraneibacter faecis]
MKEDNRIVALYVRVSTGYQVDKDSLPFQKKELKAYCEHVLHIDKNRIEIFEDAGKSGKNTKRPAFERMMDKVKAGQVSHVVVYKIDRISRNLIDFSIMYNEFKYHRVAFISLNEQFDTSSAMGEAMLKIVLVFAEMERKLTSERVTDVMIGRAQSGLWNGARVPYGWDWDDEKKCPVHSKVEAKYVKQMYADYLNGGSSVSIAKSYNANKIPTKRGGEWTSKTIADVIRNPMNKGDYRYNYRESARGRKKPQEEVIYIKGVFEPLVSINDWEKANKLMDGRGFKMNSSGQIIMNKRCNVFTGLIFCGKCGERYNVRSKDCRQGSGFRPSSYACGKKSRKGTCDNQNISDVIIAPIMINYIAAMVDVSKHKKQIKTTKELEQVILKRISFSDVAGISEDSLQATLDLLYGKTGTQLWSANTVSQEDKSENKQKLTELQVKLEKTERAIERLKKAFLFDDDGIDEKEFLEMKSALEIDRVKIENEIKGMETESISVNVNQVEFIKTASQYLLMHELNKDENINYKELAITDEDSIKTLFNSVLDHITVIDKHITEIVFKNGLTHKLLYK